MMTFKTYLNEFNCIVVSQQTFLVFQDVFKTSSRRLQRNNFSSSKTSSRRLQDVLAIRLPETSSRRLQDVFKITSQDVFKTFSRHLIRQKMLHWRRLQDVFKTSPPKRLHQDECLLGWFFPAIWNKRNKEKHIIKAK